MKIDFTMREIEIILMLLNEVASEEFPLGNSAFYSVDELTLVNKLENALKAEMLLKETLDMETNPSGLRH
jgi:hypothetical protein